MAAGLAMVAAMASTAAPAPAQSDPGGTTVRIAFPRDDGSLTPYTFGVGYPLMALVYDTLLWRDADGVPQPGLARSVEPSPDGLRLTVHLAEGARWHDGVPVTAADVAFTFKFVADNPHPRFTPQLSAVESVEEQGPSTVVVSLRHRSSGFLDQPLADMPILPAHLWRAISPRQAVPPGLPVGSGPYRLVEHSVGEGYRFEANPDYFLGPPVVDTIEVAVIEGAEATFEALERGRIDMLPVGLSDDDARRLEGPGVALARGASYPGLALTMNVNRPPLDRLEVRQAISRAIDVTRMAKSLPGVVPADHGLVHPGSPWAPAEVLHVVDEAGAKAVLAPLDLRPVEVLAPADEPVKEAVAQKIAVALRRAGMRAQARSLDAEDLARLLVSPGSVSFDLAVEDISPAVSYDPESLRTIFAPGPPGGAQLHAGYRSDAFDQLVAGIAATADPEQRRAVVGDALRLLDTDVPVVPLFFASGTYAYRPAAHDRWVFVKGSGILDKRSFVDPPPAAPKARPPRTPVEVEDQPREGRSVLPLAVVALLAIAAVIAVVAVRRR